MYAAARRPHDDARPAAERARSDALPRLARLACGTDELLNHTFVPSGYAMDDVYASLDAHGAACHKAVTPAFIDFLGTRGCSRLMHSLRTSHAEEARKLGMSVGLADASRVTSSTRSAAYTPGTKT